jgi:hypothetical protein
MQVPKSRCAIAVSRARIVSLPVREICFNAEEGCVLMPDGSIVTVDVKDNPYSERYIPRTAHWKSLGSTVANLQGPPCCGCLNYPPKNKCYYPPGETRSSMLMPDGTVFATGATHTGQSTGHTAIYTPGSGWKAGPDFPNGDQAGDDFAALLPNGYALIEANSGTLYEWDGTNLTRETVNAGGSLMVLPTGKSWSAGLKLIRARETTSQHGSPPFRAARPR